MGLEREIEAINNGESPVSPERLVVERLDEVVKYLTFEAYKEGPRPKKAAIMETLRQALPTKMVSRALCSEQYLFCIEYIRRNARVRKIPEGILELSYEAYADSVKGILAFHQSLFVQAVLNARGRCYFSLILRSAESPNITDLFPCFFSLVGAPLLAWVEYLVERNAVGLIVKALMKSRRKQKPTHFYTKLLYLLVSFTGNIFRQELTGSAVSYFYFEVEKHFDLILDIVFFDEDAANRISALEVVREYIKTVEFIPEASGVFDRFLMYLESSPVLGQLSSEAYSPAQQLRAITMVNLLARTVRFKQPAVRSFLSRTHLLQLLMRYVHKMPSHVVSNEMCGLLNELVYVDKVFYIDALVDAAREARAQTLSRQTKVFADSFRKSGANVAISDCLTPIFCSLYTLFDACNFECATQSIKQTDSCQTLRRFSVFDQETPCYNLHRELLFLQDEEYEWYRRTRVQEYRSRISLVYIGRGPEKISENEEQTARYFCSCILSLLPVFPEALRSRYKQDQ